jgi:hypothetical protein
MSTKINLSATDLSLLANAVTYGDRDRQLSDNYSNLDVQCASKILELTYAETVKVLNASPLFSVEHRDYTKNRGGLFPRGAIVWITTEGVNAWFDHKEATAPAAPEVPVTVEPVNMIGSLTTDEFNALMVILNKAKTEAENTPMVKKESDVVFGMFAKFGI